MATANGNASRQYKVVLIPGTLHAHALPFTRLARSLVKLPGVTICASQPPPNHANPFPAEVKLIKIPGIQDGENSFHATTAKMEGAFKQLANTATGWIDSIGSLVPLVPVDAMTSSLIEICQWAKTCDMDMILCEPALNITNHLQAICRDRGIALVAVVCPSRPDPLMNPLNLIPLLFSRHFRALLNVLSTMNECKAKITAAVGMEGLPDSDLAPQLLPGSRALISGKLHPRQLFTSSLFPLGVDVGGAPYKLPAGGLRTWLEQSNLPIVYIATGTLLEPTPGLVQRIAEGLNLSNMWRVVWSLPESEHKFLPADLPQEIFRVEKFVPQIELLHSGLIACHLSHCGANSTHESMSAGVPMVCMPFYCDQYEWASSICNDVRAGVQLDNKTVTASDIREAVKKVVYLQEYSQKARAASTRMRAHAKAVGQAVGVDTLNDGGSMVAAQVILQLLQGKQVETLFQEVKATTDQFSAPKPSSCCLPMCG